MGLHTHTLLLPAADTASRDLAIASDPGSTHYNLTAGYMRLSGVSTQSYTIPTRRSDLLPNASSVRLVPGRSQTTHDLSDRHMRSNTLVPAIRQMKQLPLVDACTPCRPANKHLYLPDQHKSTSTGQGRRMVIPMFPVHVYVLHVLPHLSAPTT